jgi:hypothetical protein
MAICALPAAADSLTFTLNQDSCSGSCLNLANPSAGTVKISQNGSSVDVLVTLTSTFGLTNAGAHNSFTFNLNGNPTINITSLTTGFNWGTPGNNPGFGAFGVFVDCRDGTAPDACGTGGSSPYYGTLSFTVSKVSGSLSINDFVGNSDSPPIFFAADVFSKNTGGGTGTGNTGAVGAIGPGTLTSTPEPDSLAMLGAGLLGLGSLTRRRK